MSEIKNMGTIYKCLACGKRCPSVNAKQICPECKAKEPVEEKVIPKALTKFPFVCKKCSKQCESINAQDGLCRECHATKKKEDGRTVVVERILGGEKKFSATAVGAYWPEVGARQFLSGRDLLDERVRFGFARGILRIVALPEEENSLSNGTKPKAEEQKPDW
ncbi:MAG: hypothetical protein COV47_05865 [Candidatus Diapherotrites archaeon CG11_big_fil_rev_8_21_14_0_20_37_9]|nr:MAG: hypothetical protein COV47_05865 [Candidatus Diapherotrites archaeon CG11_big_fil_rev_8_21_14_0_20_37_9]